MFTNLLPIYPSPLNPIWCFKYDTPRWWDNNQFSKQRDRANYFKPWPFTRVADMYFESPNSLELRICKCTDFTTLAVYNSTTVGTNLRRVRILMDEAVTLEKVFMQVNVINGEYNINTPPVGNAFVPINAGTLRGFQYKFERSFNVESFSVQINIAVGMVNLVDIYYYRVNPDNNQDVTLLGQSAEDWTFSTGTVLKFGTLPNVVAKRQWSKGSILKIIIVPRGVDAFSLAYLGGPTVGVETPYVEGSVVNYQVAVVAELQGVDCIYSELFQVYRNKTQDQAAITFKNKRAWAHMPANVDGYGLVQTAELNNVFPQEYEDIEVAPGEFTRLRNEQKTQLALETDFMPDYAHEQLKLQMSCDQFAINNVEYIQQEPYTFDPAKHTALSKGQVTLTERKSILKNVI